MDITDTLSIILSFCDCGSDYKSWVLVCRLWNDTIVSVFSNPKRLFGNKLINIIEESNSLERINEISYSYDTHMEYAGYSDLIGNITKNRYVPQWWKEKHIRKQSCFMFTSDTTTYSLEYMYREYKEVGRLFSSEKIFCRPFENEDAFNNFYNKLVHTYKFCFVAMGQFDFHHSVSLSRILSLDEITVNWIKIPISHYGYLSDEDWVILEDHGVSKTIRIPSNFYQIYWWARYKSTTIEMILELKSKPDFCLMEISDTQLWLFVCGNPNLSVDVALDILKMDNNNTFLSNIISNEFGCD